MKILSPELLDSLLTFQIESNCNYFGSKLSDYEVIG
jgi:serine/threonine protein kinase